MRRGHGGVWARKGLRESLEDERRRKRARAAGRAGRAAAKMAARPGQSADEAYAAARRAAHLGLEATGREVKP